MKYVIECQNLTKSYGNTTVLNDLNFAMQPGEITALCGESGCGKSTLLNVLGALDNFDSGSVKVFNREIASLTENKKAQLRNNNLGFVYQFHHLINEFTAEENIAMPLLIAGEKLKPSLAKANSLLDKVALADKAKSLPSELSGGERQRVAIARAIATNPKCVLMDEPTGNLDNSNSEAILQLLLNLNQEFAISYLIVTHDLQLANKLPKKLSMANGKLS